ncbi:MAG: NCS2 family nucleobase:cation symporter [Treponema sp.]|jgi:uracil permease|nr:NCS2 family nucleobase:cation symporter [Treponema sp.]
MAQSDIYGPADRPPLGKWIPLSIQHVFAMFGATILVPLLTGLNPAAALFTAGTGTLIYIAITGAKVPAFLGSSFAFIVPITAIAGGVGGPNMAYALGGAVASGCFYIIVGLIIRLAGTKWLDKALPPVVIGSVIVVIGLNLAPTAMAMAMNVGGGLDGKYSLVLFSIAAVTLGVTVASNVLLKGFFSVIPILIGLVSGYVFTLVMGLFFPAYHLIDFKIVTDAPWFGLPAFILPKFSLIPMLTFVIVSLATICEHLGDTLVTSKVVGQDFYKKPGLHRTLAGDGLATAWAAFWGGPPNTTYGENIGVMAITRVYSVWVIGGAAVVATALSLFQKFGALIRTIPTPVMGGISMLLFGIIASSGLRTIVESGVDYKDKRNLTISSVIFVIGIGGGKLIFNITKDVQFQLAGVALATVVGIILNLVFPSEKNQAK